MVYAAAHNKIATFNANGLTTKVPVSNNFSEDRHVQVCRFLYRNSIHVMELPEAHIKDEQCLEQLTERFKDRGFVLLSNPSPKGRGGAALIFHNTWTLLNSWAIEKRHLFAQLSDPDGVKHHFCVYHFHHDAVERQRQWTLLSQIAPTLVPRDTIYLSDHNSVTVPSRDISAPHLSPEHSTVIAAREAELHFLTNHELIDTYACFHGGRNSDFDLEGWTWGVALTKPTASASPDLTANECTPVLDRRRRIDRILLHENF